MRLRTLAASMAQRRAGRVLVCCALIVMSVALANRQDSGGEGEDGKGEKRASGISYESSTEVEYSSRPSASNILYDAERVWSGYDDWEPALAVAPNSRTIYQTTTRYNGPPACVGCPFPYIAIRKSTDGGDTWGSDHPIPITRNEQNDPQVEVARDGTVYLVWIDGYRPGVRFSKSRDGGHTWSKPLKLTPRNGSPSWSDKPALAISATGRNVYIGFNASDHYVASSHDYGASFTVSPKLNHDSRYWFDTAGAVAPNGDVYFFTSDFSQDYSGHANISVVSSRDRGAHWLTTRVDTSREMPGCAWSDGCTFGFFGTIGGLAVDSRGNVLIAYNASTVDRGPMQLYTRSSRNGVAWGPRRNIGGGPTVNHHSVAVAAAPRPGDFVVVWQDDRKGARTAFNAWLRHTNTLGLTWDAPVRLSDRARGAPYKSPKGHRFPYGDYLEVAVDSKGHYHAIWGEGESYTGPGGTWYTKSY